MNVEIKAEAAIFPEKEYINGIAVAVQGARKGASFLSKFYLPLPLLVRCGDESSLCIDLSLKHHPHSFI